MKRQAGWDVDPSIHARANMAPAPPPQVTLNNAVKVFVDGKEIAAAIEAEVQSTVMNYERRAYFEHEQSRPRAGHARLAPRGRHWRELAKGRTRGTGAARRACDNSASLKRRK
jgi:hypothetical protein